MNRREWLGTSLAAPLLSADGVPAQPCSSTSKRTRVAGVVTVYRYNSHADVLVGRLLAGYSPNAKWTQSNSEIVSLYVDQVPNGTDMSRDLAPRNNFRLCQTISEALTMGGKTLAVDGVVFIGEHGDYPTNSLGQILYPRYELFSQIMDVYEQCGHSVPTFFDKHFSYSWDKAEAMFRRAKKIGFPLMAGSSIPLTVRRPAIDPPLETPITEALIIGYGPADAYGFHTLEALQCLVERRKGGETGIASVQWIEGEEIWQWRDSSQGAWSKPLLEAAFRLQPLPSSPSLEQQAKDPVLFVLNYRDGLKAAALVLTKNAGGWSAALRTTGKTQLTSVAFGEGHGPAITRPLPNWDGIAKCVDDFLASGKPPNPAERTLLVTGALAFCFESKRRKEAIKTDQLAISYRAPERSWFQTS